MRRKRICAVCMTSIMAASMMMSSTAMAQEDIIAVPHQEESAWDKLAVTNDDTVSTGINIRSSASENSQVIGYLYNGGAAWVLNRGEEWTEVYSGGLTGFVKNEYLVYGEDAKNTAQNHGTEGVATTWDDVKLYSGADGGSDVVESLEYGDSFILTQDNGHWLQVQRGADDVAYVSAEDVSRVLLLDTAVATDAVYQQAEGSSDTYTEASYTDETYTDDTYTETSNTGETYPEETYMEDTGAWEDYTEETYPEETYTEETSAGDTSYDDSAEEYYDADADTVDDTSYDSSTETGTTEADGSY